ncbi:hypothetical protein BHE74_00014563 [Ensete ventricosum]|nr:hypothetical protein BHE74_00014563 [Ensete ventricosum]
MIVGFLLGLFLDLSATRRVSDPRGKSSSSFPYRSVPAGMSGTYRSIRLRYVDRPLPDGTAKIDHRRSIEGEKGKKKKRRKRRKNRRIRKYTLHRPRPWVAREPSPPSLVIFLPRGEKDRGDNLSRTLTSPKANDHFSMPNSWAPMSNTQWNRSLDNYKVMLDSPLT